MNTIIAGSRDLPVDVADIEAAVRESGFPITTVLSGHSGNVDRAAERWAEQRGIPCLQYPADWKKYGRAAGPKRGYGNDSYRFGPQCQGEAIRQS